MLAVTLFAVLLLIVNNKFLQPYLADDPNVKPQAQPQTHAVSAPPPPVNGKAVPYGHVRAFTEPLENEQVATITFVLHNGKVATERVGKHQTSGVTITPKIKGTWIWDSDKELKFAPSEFWEPETRYEIEVARSILAADDQLADQPAKNSFITPMFSAKLQKFEYYENPENRQIKNIVATVLFR